MAINLKNTTIFATIFNSKSHHLGTFKLFVSLSLSHVNFIT